PRGLPRPESRHGLAICAGPWPARKAPVRGHRRPPSDSCRTRRRYHGGDSRPALRSAFSSMNILKWGVALFLFTLGVYRLFRANHPSGAGMRVGGRDLFVWSFLMASAHGAGLMLLPVLMAQPMPGMTHSMAGEMTPMP